MTEKLYGYLLKNEREDDKSIRFSATVDEFLEATGARNLLEVAIKDKVFNINGANYKILNFTFGSHEPLVLECESMDTN